MCVRFKRPKKRWMGLFGTYIFGAAMVAGVELRGTMMLLLASEVGWRWVELGVYKVLRQNELRCN
jgi:hypothetical protein